MSKIRFTMVFRRVDAASALAPATEVSVLLSEEWASFEAAVEKATALLPQGPQWKAPLLVEAYEESDE